MTQSLRVHPLQGDFEEAVAAETTAEGVEALALTVTDNTNNPEFTYSATAEDNLHQTSEADYIGLLDAQPGITFNGPAGAATHLHLKVTNLDISEGTIAPEATDEVVAMVAVNSTIVGYMETEDSRAGAGGFATSIDDASAVTYNFDGDISVAEGDVIRIGIQSRDEETDDWDIAEGGEWVIF